MFVFKLIIGLCLTLHDGRVINTFSYPWLEQITRQELLSLGCDHLERNWENNVNFSQLDHFLVDTKHKFLYCYVPKVACTNWKRVLMVLTERSNATDLASIPANVAHEEGTLTKLPEFSQQQIQYILNNFTSFMMVRHPFERLLSAYRNKLEGNNRSAKYFQARIGRHIIRTYRKNAKRKDVAAGDNVTFREFVRYLITEGVDNDDTNEHWRPIYRLCHPCSLSYTFIGKYEKLDDDASIILKMIGAPYVQFPQTRSSHTNKRLKLYFKSLNLDDIRKLYKLYELDFKLFGYNLESILGYDIG